MVDMGMETQVRMERLERMGWGVVEVGVEDRKMEVPVVMGSLFFFTILSLELCISNITKNNGAVKRILSKKHKYFQKNYNF